MKFILRLIKKIFSRKEIMEINKNLAEIIKTNILNLPQYQNKKNLLKHGYKVFSQQDEDGIIMEIFNRIKTTNRTFIEIGVETGLECNTTNLLLQNWNGLWIESNQEHVKKIKKNFEKFHKNLKVLHAMVTITNVNQILQKYFSNKQEIDLLSIDIGVNTYHVLKNIKLINPRVIVTEYNASYGPIIDWSAEYKEYAEWDGTNYFGASLQSFCKMLKKKNYYLVGCNITGANAFFIRGDQINKKFEAYQSANYHFMRGKHWLKRAYEKDYSTKKI
jgi:hypothetical protein